MKIIFHKTFQKKSKRRSNEECAQLKNKLVTFTTNPLNSILNNHALHGKYLGYRSINITGNLRAVYKMQDENIAFFVDIDNHANLYK